MELRIYTKVLHLGAYINVLLCNKNKRFYSEAGMVTIEIYLLPEYLWTFAGIHFQSITTLIGLPFGLETWYAYELSSYTFKSHITNEYVEGSHPLPVHTYAYTIHTIPNLLNHKWFVDLTLLQKLWCARN